MEQFIKLYKEEAFAKNIAICRNFIFKLRYTDITAMTGINQSTMSTYDATPTVSPFLTPAKKIAEMYCTNLDDLCSYQIDFDIRKCVSMMRNFIERVRYIDVSEYKEQIHSKIDAAYSVYEYDIYAMIVDVYNEVIDRMCRDRAYHVVYQKPECGVNFTNNYNRLMADTGVTTRKIAKACSLAKGTLTRLKQGFEPSLSTAIKLADFFGLEIEQLLLHEPDFDIPVIMKNTEKKEIISNVPIKIDATKFKEVMDMKTNELGKEKAKELVDAELWCISTKKLQNPDDAFKN